MRGIAAVLMIVVGVGLALVAGFYALLDAIGADGVEFVIGAAAILVAGRLVGGWAMGVRFTQQERKARLRLMEAEALLAENHAAFVWADGRGLFPVSPDYLATVQGSLSSMEIARLGQDVQRQAPRSLHWSVSGDAPAAQLTVQQDAQVIAPPSFSVLHNSGQLPRNGFLLGYDEDNQPAIADWSQLYSALVGGQSGSGKSTLVRSLLAQSAMQGGRFVVVDPHAHAGEESLAASLAPLQHLMLCNAAGDEDAMMHALQYVHSIGVARLRGDDASRDPVVLVVDETPGLLEGMHGDAVSAQLERTFNLVVRETRKVGVYAFAIGQTFQASTMPSKIRNSFATMLACAMRKDEARYMSGNSRFASAVDGLTGYSAAWLTPQREIHQLRIPNCTQADLELVAKESANGATRVIAPSISPSASPSASPSTDPEEQRIVAMLGRGLGVNAIIQELWGVKGGRAYQEKAERVGAVIQKLAKGY